MMVHSNSKEKLKIGVFDSGLGGLTIVKSMLDSLDNIDIVYIADTKNAPYGEKSQELIIDFSTEIAQYLVDNHHIDVLVVACNTATSAAISTLREKYKDLIIVGTEPGIKPALDATKNGKIGILATPSTLAGEKYQDLLEQLRVDDDTQIFEQACPGLVEQIESNQVDTLKTNKMLTNWLDKMKSEEVDTIVLGCTHYPLVASNIRRIMDSDVTLIETGIAIANRVKSLANHLGKLAAFSSTKVIVTGKIDEGLVKSIIGSDVPIDQVSLH